MIIKMSYVYVVCFYRIGYGSANVKMGGCYIDEQQAILRIHKLFGNKLSFSNNNKIVYSKGLCGWINKYDIGDNNSFGLNINQPHNPISIEISNLEYQEQYN
jgi:hypothetical protein